MASDEPIPVNLLGLCARWRSGSEREKPLPGVPWTCGQIGDHLAPILRGQNSRESEVQTIAIRGIQDPRNLNNDDVRALCAYVLNERKK